MSAEIEWRVLFEHDFTTSVLSVSRLQKQGELCYVSKSPNYATGLYDRQMEVHFPKENGDFVFLRRVRAKSEPIRTPMQWATGAYDGAK